MTEPLFGSASPVWTGIPSLPVPNNSYVFGGAPIVTALRCLGLWRSSEANLQDRPTTRRLRISFTARWNC